MRGPGRARRSAVAAEQRHWAPRGIVSEGESARGGAPPPLRLRNAVRKSRTEGRRRPLRREDALNACQGGAAELQAELTACQGEPTIISEARRTPTPMV